MAMKQSQILQLLKENYKKVSVPIPSYWFYPELDFTGELRRYNIYDLFINYFEDYIEKPHHMTPLDNFNQAIIYGALIPTTEAFQLDQEKQLVINNK